MSVQAQTYVNATYDVAQETAKRRVENAKRYADLYDQLKCFPFDELLEAANDCGQLGVGNLRMALHSAKHAAEFIFDNVENVRVDGNQ